MPWEQANVKEESNDSDSSSEESSGNNILLVKGNITQRSVLLQITGQQAPVERINRSHKEQDRQTTWRDPLDDFDRSNNLELKTKHSCVFTITYLTLLHTLGCYRTQRYAVHALERSVEGEQ